MNLKEIESKLKAFIKGDEDWIKIQLPNNRGLIDVMYYRDADLFNIYDGGDDITRCEFGADRLDRLMEIIKEYCR